MSRKNRESKTEYIQEGTKTPRHMIIKLTKIKDKDKLLKATSEKRQITSKEKPIRLSASFSIDTQHRSTSICKPNTNTYREKLTVTQ